LSANRERRVRGNTPREPCFQITWEPSRVGRRKWVLSIDAEKEMKYPISTGQTAFVLESTEPRVAEAVRRGLISPAPPVLAGRRLWQAEHVLQAAEALGVLTDELRARLEQEVVA